MSETEVASYNSQLEADLVAERLRDAGIPTRVAADNLGGAFPTMQLWQGGCKVIVDTAYADAARREITSVGTNALDPKGPMPTTPLSSENRALRVAYVVAAIALGLLVSGGWAAALFGW